MIILVVFLLVLNIAIVAMLILILRKIVSYYDFVFKTLSSISASFDIHTAVLRSIKDKFDQLTDVEL